MTEQAERPNYYAIIPANVRYDKKLPGKAALLYGEITALCNQKGYCWAGDSYFANLYDVSKQTIQNWLKALEVNSHITREVIYEEGTQKILHRYIKILVYPTQNNLNTPTQNNLGVNNTSINTTVNNTKNKKHSAADATQSVQLEKEFNVVWKQYPNKKGKAQAFNHYKAWRKKAKTNTNDYLIEKLNVYKKYIEQNQSWYHAMSGSTWFNGRFEDEYQLAADNNTQQPTTREEWFGD